MSTVHPLDRSSGRRLVTWRNTNSHRSGAAARHHRGLQRAQNNKLRPKTIPTRTITMRLEFVLSCRENRDGGSNRELHMANFVVHTPVWNAWRQVRLHSQLGAAALAL